MSDVKPRSYLYRYMDPMRGRPVWRSDNSLWNGQRPTETEALYSETDYAALEARLEAVEKERDALGRDLNRAKYGEPDFAWSTHLAVLDETIARAERAEAALATALEVLEVLSDPEAGETDRRLALKSVRALAAQEGEG